mmetsp:Transcript_15605/g.27654  ORF Transcript_15605/g.27654 Transcript_15605/m.27654 type:complete len:238 (+) Transcript_15605:1315-2028(+)
MWRAHQRARKRAPHAAVSPPSAAPATRPTAHPTAHATRPTGDRRAVRPRRRQRRRPPGCCLLPMGRARRSCPTIAADWRSTCRAGCVSARSRGQSTPLASAAAAPAAASRWPPAPLPAVLVAVGSRRPRQLLCCPFVAAIQTRQRRCCGQAGWRSPCGVACSPPLPSPPPPRVPVSQRRCAPASPQASLLSPLQRRSLRSVPRHRRRTRWQPAPPPDDPAAAQLDPQTASAPSALTF